MIACLPLSYWLLIPNYSTQGVSGLSGVKFLIKGAMLLLLLFIIILFVWIKFVTMNSQTHSGPLCPLISPNRHVIGYQPCRHLCN